MRWMTLGNRDRKPLCLVCGKWHIKGITVVIENNAQSMSIVFQFQYAHLLSGIFCPIVLFLHPSPLHPQCSLFPSLGARRSSLPAKGVWLAWVGRVTGSLPVPLGDVGGVPVASTYRDNWIWMSRAPFQNIPLTKWSVFYLLSCQGYIRLNICTLQFRRGFVYWFAAGIILLCLIAETFSLPSVFKT